VAASFLKTPFFVGDAGMPYPEMNQFENGKASMAQTQRQAHTINFHFRSVQRMWLLC
jgi:hypothetical protein